jgi:hypothetical protein
MTINEILDARYEAQKRIEEGDRAVRECAHLCAGRLRLAGVSSWILVKLKRELANFDSHRKHRNS